MSMTPDDFWYSPLGLFLDLWECHKQFTGISKPKVEVFIDDVIPSGLERLFTIFLSISFIIKED